MADWTVIPDSVLDPDAPLTSDLAYAWRDNPIAIAEGASGAPKVQGIALGGVYIGFASASVSPLAVTDLDRVKILHIDLVAGASTTWNFQMGFSNDNGATWGSYQNVGPTANAGGSKISLRFIVDLTTGAVSYVGTIPTGLLANSASLTVPADCNAIRMTATGSSPSAGGHFTVLGGAA